MIKVIGVRRLAGLTILIAANAVLAAGTYLYFMPQNEQLDRNLKKARSDISAKQSETERLRTEYHLIQEQKSQYEDLKQSGFLGSQDRIVARERMEAIQSYSRVLLADYNIMPVKVEENPDASQSNQVILSSVISANIDAIDDADIFSFIYWLQNGFPGHVAIDAVELSRVADVNDVTLRQIGSGQPLTLVKGKVDVVWRTMVPRDEAGASMTERY